jgi:hypothetical protein
MVLLLPSVALLAKDQCYKNFLMTIFSLLVFKITALDLLSNCLSSVSKLSGPHHGRKS